MRKTNTKKDGSGDRDGRSEYLIQDIPLSLLFRGHENGRNVFEIRLSKSAQWEIMQGFAAVIKHVPCKELENLQGLQMVADILLTSWKYVQSKAQTS
jgi:hypothetical protein